MNSEVLGRHVYGALTNGHGVEASMHEALNERRGVLDSFDQLGFAVAFALAWGHAESRDPSLSEGELSEVSAAAADLALRAEHTQGGWEAMIAGESSHLDEWTGVLSSLLGPAA